MPPAKKPTVAINPLFKLLLSINALLCVVSLVVMVWTANHDPMSQGQEKLYNTCEHVFTLTAGAFIGLLGGRAAAPDSMKEAPAKEGEARAR